MSSHGSGLSGGDRIYIEFAKRWSNDYPVTIITWEEGIAMMTRNNLREKLNISFLRLFIPKIIHSNFLICYLYRILISIFTSLTLHINNPENTHLYSSSEFWMDSLPSFILKLRYPTLKWVATWFQTAPSPLKGFSGGGRSHAYYLNAFMLWASQLPIRPLISKFANYVLVNNNLEKEVFPNSHTVVVLGAVDTKKTDKYIKSHTRSIKKYSAVFQGRFHPQKGVIELVDIWKKVVEKIPHAKLAMIGDGPLMLDVKKRINKLELEKNIDLMSYVFDGTKKYKTFSASLMVVHPAFFDSGGMASAEAMAFGLPCIGFNLPAYDSYYPKGMIKTPIGDLNAFAESIVDLLKNNSKRIKIGNEAGKFICESYSWDYRAREILRQIVGKKNLERKRARFQ